MAEIWGAAIAAGGALLSSYSANKQADKDKKDASNERKAATRDEALYGGILSKFEADQNYYFDRLNKKNTERGLDQFRAYNTAGNPNENRIVVPDRPDINTYLPALPIAQPKKKKRGLFDKITDPAGIFGGRASQIADPLGLFGG